MEPRQSTRLAKKRVTMGAQGSVDDPEILPYYMDAVEQGWAVTKKSCLQYGLEESEDSCSEEEYTGRTVSCQHGAGENGANEGVGLFSSPPVQ